MYAWYRMQRAGPAVKLEILKLLTTREGKAFEFERLNEKLCYAPLHGTSLD